MAFDYKKEYKALYQPPREPHLITVPPMMFAAVRGQGDPNDPAGEYKAAIELLYGLLYTIKMSQNGASPSAVQKVTARTATRRKAGRAPCNHSVVRYNKRKCRISAAENEGSL